MKYNVIGLMSGSSLDGLDIAFVKLKEDAVKWSYEWLATDCKVYPEAWLKKLKGAQELSVPEFLRLQSAYGHFTGQLVNQFLKELPVYQNPDFIVSHGHTVVHEPASGVSCQIGDGGAIAAETGIAVVSDLRNMDVALGGQGAPIVPIADRLLFSEYDYLLNLGGIANITIQRLGLAFDICPCNQLLNHFAMKAGFDYDDKGMLARKGKAEEKLLGQLGAQLYYQQAPPKSLGNDFSTQEILPLVEGTTLSHEDALATCTAHIAQTIATATKPHTQSTRPSKLLVTGGGAFNSFLIEQLSRELQPFSIEVVVPDAQLVQYKEALAMALIGALRWRNEVNVLASVTGAKHDSIGGAIWAGKP